MENFNLVAEMHLYMVLKCTKNEKRALITSIRTMRVVSSITKPMSSEECYNKMERRDRE
jgi:hypothetical protein